MSDLSTVPGTVTYFDRVHGYGYVRTQKGRLSFGATSWHAGRPARWPRRGEPVEVVLIDGERLLEVRKPR